MRFGVDSVFETDSDLFLVVEDTPESGWANVNLNFVGPEDHEFEGIELHQDRRGLVGLPVIGFAAEHFVNAFVLDGVLANYGGLFGHKASVRRIAPDCNYHELPIGCDDDL
jgi:hypothetical protein